MDDSEALAAEQQEVKNPFPTPPVYWNRYTPENLRLLAALKDKIAERNGSSDPASIEHLEEPIDQSELLPYEPLLPSFPLLELEPPRLDWILEEDEYSTFGEYHSTRETTQVFPAGVKRLYDPEPGADPRPHLRQLLVSLLASYHKLLSDVLEPVPSGYHGHPPPEIIPLLESGEATWPPPLNWEATIHWMRDIVLNLGWAVNEYRPVQARMALESMMQRQIDVRREETKAIHSKCDELEKVLTELRQNSLANRSPSPVDKSMVVELNQSTTAPDLNNSSLTLDVAIPTTYDLIQWSKEVPI